MWNAEILEELRSFKINTRLIHLYLLLILTSCVMSSRRSNIYKIKSPSMCQTRSIMYVLNVLSKIAKKRVSRSRAAPIRIEVYKRKYRYEKYISSITN